MNYQTIKVRFQEKTCFLQLHRPEANNTINARMIEECHAVLASCEETITVLVLEGLPEVFCFGADFDGICQKTAHEQFISQDPEPLYELWRQLAAGSYVTVAHVRGKVNAGGVGFAAACDVVLADSTAQFSLSELLFGLFPACVLPFLIRRIGFQRAHYLTLTTRPIAVQEALSWGLVDAFDAQSEALLHRHLSRFKRLPKVAIKRYKHYANTLQDVITQSKPPALAANREMFSDTQNLKVIARFVETGQFPWEP